MADFPEIRIDVGIDESSISSSYDKIIAKTKSLESVIQSAMSKLSSSGGGALAVKSFEKSIEEVTRLFNSLRREMSEQLSFSVGVDTSRVTADFAEARSGVLSSLANMEASIQQSALSGEINLTRLTDAVGLTQESLSVLDEKAFASESSMRELSESFSSLGNSVESISSISEVSSELEESLIGIASVTDVVSDNTNQLGDSLEDVSDTLKDTSKQSDDTSKGIKNLGDSSDIASSAISSLVRELLLLVSIDKLKDLAIDSVKLSSSLVELKNVTDTVFGESAYLIENFADTSIESFGLAEVSAKEYASTVGAILGATGLKDTIGSDALAQMSINLTKLTADMSSFRNMEFDEVFSKIKSAITGETEAIKSLGVAIYEADMQEYMLRNNIDGTWASLDNNTKILLRYNKIMEDTSFVQGDFQKTSGSFANSTRVLQERWTELLTLWGNYLIPAITPAINILGNLLAILSEVTTQLAQLFGWSDYQVVSASMVSNTASMSDYLASGVSEADDLTSSVKAAGAQAKKSLAPFTELNILSSNKSGSGAGGGGNGASFNAGGTKVDLANPYADGKTLSYLDELQEKLNKLKISSKAKELVDFLKGIWDFLVAISPLAEGVLVGILSYSVLKKLATGWDNLVGSAGGFKKLFSGDFSGDANTKIMKLAAAAGVATAEFKLLKTVFDKFVLDKFNKATGELDMTFGDVITTIGATVAIVGVASTALYALLGPVGLLVSGFALALAGIKAYTEYQDLQFQSSMERNLGGTQDFSDALDQLFNRSFSGLADSLSELEASMEVLGNLKTATENAVTELDKLVNISLAVDGSVENLPDKLDAVTSSLTKQAEELVTAEYQWVLYEISKSGLDEKTKEDMYATATDNFNKDMERISKLDVKVNEVREDSIATDDELRELIPLIADVAELTGEEIVYEVSIDVSDVDFSDTDAVIKEAEKFKDAKKALEEQMLDDKKEYISNMLSRGFTKEEAEEAWGLSEYNQAFITANQEIKEAAAQWLSEAEKGYSIVISELGRKADTKAIAESLGVISDLVLDSMEDILDAGGTDKQIFGLAESTLTSLQESNSWLESAVRTEFPDGVWQSISEFFNPDVTYEDEIGNWKKVGSGRVLEFAEGLKDPTANAEVSKAKKDMFSSTFLSMEDGLGIGFGLKSKELGGDFARWYSNGISENSSLAVASAGDMGVDTIESLRASQDSASPSKVTQSLGADFVDGYVLGISENSALAITSSNELATGVLASLSSKNAEAVLAGQGLATAVSDGFALGQGGLETSLKSVLDSMSEILNKWVSNLASSFSSIGTSLSSIKSAGDVSTSASKINNIKIPKLATGAVIQPNSEFVSILGDQKSGVNIESPLATMVDAFTRALDSRGGSGFNGVIQIPVYVDGELNSMQVIDTQELERYRSNGR